MVMWHFNSYSHCDVWKSWIDCYCDTYYEDFGRGSVLGEHMDSTDNVFGTVNISGRYIIH